MEAGGGAVRAIGALVAPPVLAVGHAAKVLRRSFAAVNDAVARFKRGQAFSRSTSSAKKAPRG